MINLDNLQLVDYLRSGALVVAFIFVMLGDKRGSSTVWIKAEVIFMAGMGATLYIWPNILVHYQVEIADMDPLQVFQTRILGSMYIAFLLFWYFSEPDTGFQAAWLISRVIGGIMLLTTMWHAHTHFHKEKVHMKDQHISYSMLGVALTLLGSLIHLLRSQDFGRLSLRGLAADRVGIHILVHILVMFPATVAQFAYTEDFVAHHVALKNFHLDGLHLYLANVVNVIGLMSLLLCVLLAYSSKPDNRRAYLLAFAINMLLLFPWWMLLQWKHGVYRPASFRILMGFIVAITGNAAMGVFAKA